MQKGRMKGLSQRGHELSNGMFGIKALDSKFISSRQIEAARIAATRYMKREGQLWIKIFPDKPITKKPLEVRMGKGKGALDHYVAVVKPRLFWKALVMLFDPKSWLAHLLHDLLIFYPQQQHQRHGSAQFFEVLVLALHSCIQIPQKVEVSLALCIRF